MVFGMHTGICIYIETKAFHAKREESRGSGHSRSTIQKGHTDHDHVLGEGQNANHSVKLVCEAAVLGSTTQVPMHTAHLCRRHLCLPRTATYP